MIPQEVKEIFEKQMKQSKSKNVAFVTLKITEQNKPHQIVKVVPFNKVEESIGSLSYIHTSTIGNPVFSDKDTIIKLLYRS